MKEFKSLILKNKIKVGFCQNEALNSINIGFYFNCGIVYESLKNNGITHLVEHLFFRKLDNIKQKDLYFKMESIGSTLRAKTYANFVCFDMTISKKFFVPAVELMLMLLSDFEWSENDLKKELEVVRKQIEFNSSENFSSFVNRNYFKGTKLNKPIMGNMNSLNNLSLLEINNWKKTFFNSNNVCCVLTGGFSKENLKIFLEKLSLVKESSMPILKKQKITPKNFCKRNIHSDLIVETDWQISDISIIFDINKNINLFSANIISSILGEGVGSNLSLALREETALTDEIYSRIDRFRDINRLVIEYSTYNRDIEKSLRLVFLEIAKLKKKVTQNELLSSKVFFTDNQLFVFDSPRKCNFLYGWNNFVLQDETDIYNDIKQYEGITTNKILNSAKQIFVPENLSITITNNQDIYDYNKLNNLIQQLRSEL